MAGDTGDSSASVIYYKDGNFHRATAAAVIFAGQTHTAKHCVEQLVGADQLAAPALQDAGGGGVASAHVVHQPGRRSGKQEPGLPGIPVFLGEQLVERGEVLPRKCETQARAAKRHAEARRF